MGEYDPVLHAAKCLCSFLSWDQPEIRCGRCNPQLGYKNVSILPLAEARASLSSIPASEAESASTVRVKPSRQLTMKAAFLIALGAVLAPSMAAPVPDPVAAPVPEPVAMPMPEPSPVRFRFLHSSTVLLCADPSPFQPGIPATSTARSYLSSLRVAAQGPQTGYSRDKFPHWITQSGSCDTREVALKRDGTGVVQSSSCAATSGSWKSPYDGATWRASSDVDIDHMVPLSNAWKSGAAAWTTARRQAFANDLGNPQLWTVTDNVNQSKGDQGPEEWKPPLASFYCTYARSWIKVKHEYDLTVTSAEKSALSSMLGTC